MLSLGTPFRLSAPAPSASSLPSLFSQTGSNEEPSFGHSPSFGQTGSNRGLSFGLVWPNDAEKEGSIGGRGGSVPGSQKGTGREQMPRRGSSEEHMLGSGGRVLRKKEETEGKEVVPERRMGTVSERRRGSEGHCWEGKEMEAVLKGGEETEAASKEGRKQPGVERKGGG